MSRDLKRILVFRVGQMGDTLAALPSLWVLRRRFPDAKIVVISEVPTNSSHVPPEAVLPQVGLVDAFAKYPSGISLKNVIASWRQFRRYRNEGFDTLVYLTPSERSRGQRVRDQIFFRACGINYLLATKGFSRDQKPKLANGTLAVKHKEADALLGRLALNGIEIPLPPMRSHSLEITEAERARASTWWTAKVKDTMPHTGWFALCTGGKVSAKRWPWERYADVGQRLIENHGLLPVIIGGAEDCDIATKLLSAWGTGLSAAGELSVREAAALMVSARFYLGNDTGVMHLAAAAGRPCVAVFSARDWPGIWEPYGPGHKVFRHDVSCSGCLLSVCNRQSECLLAVEPSDVYEACVEVLLRAPLPYATSKSKIGGTAHED